MSNDLISRSALVRELKEAEAEYKAKLHENDNDDPFIDGVLSAVFSFLKTIKDQPSVEVEAREQIKMIDYAGICMVPEELCTIDRLGGADDFLGCGSCFEADNEGNCENCVVQKIFDDYARVTGQILQSEKDISNAEYQFGEWILCSERLPEEKTNPVTNDYYVYPVTFNSGEITDIRYYSFGNGHWHHGLQIMDKYVTAWMPVPRPYREEVMNEH